MQKEVIRDFFLNHNFLVGAVEALANQTSRTTTLFHLSETWPDVASPIESGVTHTKVRTARRLRQPELDELAEAYKTGATVYELADRFKIHRKTVGLRLQAMGIDTRPPALTPDQVQVAVDLYHNGWSLARIAAKFIISPHGVSNCLRNEGVNLRSRGGANSDEYTNASPRLL